MKKSAHAHSGLIQNKQFHASIARNECREKNNFLKGLLDK